MTSYDDIIYENLGWKQQNFERFIVYLNSMQMPAFATKIRARSIIKLKELNMTISEDTYDFTAVMQWNWNRNYSSNGSISFDTIKNYKGNILTITVDVEILKVYDDNNKDITKTYKFVTEVQEFLQTINLEHHYWCFDDNGIKQMKDTKYLSIQQINIMINSLSDSQIIYTKIQEYFGGTSVH